MQKSKPYIINDKNDGKKKYEKFEIYCRYSIDIFGIIHYNMKEVCVEEYPHTRREGSLMAEIRVKENESLDSALRRFKRQCQRSGIQAELRKRECYEKPSVKRKKKSEAARKRKYK